MTKPTKDSRNEAFDKATDLQVRLYSESGKEITTLCDKHGLTDGVVRRNFSLLVGDVILGFYKDTEILELLQSEVGVDKGKALSITADLLDFLAPLKEAEDNGESSTEISNTPVEESAAEPSNHQQNQSLNEALQPPPSPTVPEPEPAEEVVYTSTQSALIKEGRDDEDDDSRRWSNPPSTT